VKVLLLSTSALLVALALDLIFLFFMDVWYDPSRIILISELIALVGCMALGVVGFIVAIKNIYK